MASVVEKDYLQRQIRQLAELLGKLLGLGRAGKQEEAAEELRQGALTLLGLDFATLCAIDSRSGVMLLGSADRVELFASLLDADAELADVEGDAARAELRRHHALEVRLEAVLSFPSTKTEQRARVGLAGASADALDPRYRALLGKLLQA